MAKRLALLAIVLATVPAAAMALPAPIEVGKRAEQYACMLGPPFKPSALDNSRGFENGSDPLAQALSQFLDGDAKQLPVDLPRHGWYLIANAGDHALVGEGTPVDTVMQFELREYAWHWAGLGGCFPRAYRDGLRASKWSVAPKQKLRRRTRNVRVRVQEEACSSGRDARGRILAPWVHYGKRRVIVTFHVTPLTGPQTCPGVPPTPATLRLDQPLRGRALVDGGKL